MHCRWLGEVDSAMGNEEAFRTGFGAVKSMERGVATHIYAAFDPNLSGKVSSDSTVGSF